MPTRPPEPLTTIGGLAGDLSELAIAEGQLIAVSTDGTVVSLDAETGAETGATPSSPRPTARSALRRATQVIVDPALVDDPAAVADTLAGLLDDDADRIEAAIARRD